MSDYLPPELHIEILALLPVKSLLRFRCVSKRWCSLITSPSFEALHLNNTTSKSRSLLVFKQPIISLEKPYIPLAILDEYVEKFFVPYWSSIQIAGSCNGVICLTNFESFILWNPSIRRTLTIPFPTEFSFYIDLCFLGFGFDSITNEYKMVYVIPTLARVYSLRRGSWSTVTTKLIYYYNVGQRTDSVFLNGACHWVTCCFNSHRNRMLVIVVFDLKDELLREIEAPCFLIGESGRTMNLSTFDGLLVLARLWNGQCDVWAMKEYGVTKSWMKLYNFQYICPFKRLLSVRRCGDIILENILGDVVCYSPNTRKLIKQLNSHKLFFYLNTYVESLVLCREVIAAAKEEEIMCCLRLESLNFAL